MTIAAPKKPKKVSKKLKAYRAGTSMPVTLDESKIKVLQRKVLNQTDFRVAKGERRNNNKFYVMELQTDGQYWRIFSHYGRVGDSGTRDFRFSDSEEHGIKEFESILASKKKGRSGSQGYKEVELEQALVGSQAAVASSDKKDTKSKSQKTSKSQLHPLVRKFVTHIF